MVGSRDADPGPYATCCRFRNIQYSQLLRRRAAFPRSPYRTHTYYYSRFPVLLSLVIAETFVVIPGGAFPDSVSTRLGGRRRRASDRAGEVTTRHCLPPSPQLRPGQPPPNRTCPVAVSFHFRESTVTIPLKRAPFLSKRSKQRP